MYNQWERDALHHGPYFTHDVLTVDVISSSLPSIQIWSIDNCSSSGSQIVSSFMISKEVFYHKSWEYIKNTIKINPCDLLYPKSHL